MRKSHRAAVVLMVISCILLFSVLAAPAFAVNERPDQCSIVKVGYFDFDGYYNRGENGEKSGYGYEYLQELKKYANWKYEYVYAPYEECLKLLAAGKIDLLTSVSYSEARDQLFDYSENSMGIKSNILTVKSSNTKYVLGEYSSFNGIHVGMLSGNSSNAKFKEFSQKYHFTYTYDDSYTNTDELWNALQNGTIDGIITSNLRKTNNERVIAEFSPSPYYAIVKGGNSKLLGELNAAIEKINIVSPVYQSNLYQKYYGTDSQGVVAFSLEELAYIKNNPELSILIPPSARPMAYLEDGIAQGIVPELIQKALAPSGLKLNCVICNSGAEYEKEFKNKTKYPVIGLANDNDYYGEANNLRLTAPYLTINYNIITKSGSKYDRMIVAAVKGEPFTKNYVEKHFAAEKIKYYKNNEECVKAILDGEATHTIMNAYIAESIMENDARNRLVGNTLMGFSSNFAISVDGDADYLLFSIINKCVNALSQDDARSILIQNTLYKKKPLSFVEYIYVYPAQAIIVVILFFSIVISIIILAARQHRLKKEQMALEETAHFARIATEASGEITELNIDNMLMILYSFIDKKLVKKEIRLSASSLSEITHSQIIDPDHLAEYNELFSKKSLWQLAGKDLQKTCTLRMKDADGNYHWILFTLQGIPTDSAHPHNLMIFQKNIDDLKLREQLREQQMIDALNTARAASEAKSTFMSRMSHEIRTPLNGVIGYMTIAQNNTDNIDKANACITKAQVAAKHLLAIINDVLDMSSIESGKLKISQVSFDFRELISEIATVFYMQAQAKNVNFEVVANNVSEDFLIGDRMRVNQILLNLLSNAVKFTPSGGSIFFTIEQTAIKNNKVFIRFIVADNGIGMTKEFQEKLFMPFEQQDASIAQKYGGSGIGLSITKNLTTMMNGIIEVESKQGEGSTFRVELPFILDTSAVKSDMTSQDFSHLNALIVDDEQSACEYMSILLQRCGVRCQYALSGKIAVEMVSKAYQTNQAFNLCLMDWEMPDMGGVETVKHIRECAGGDMPIIIVTAYDFSAIEEPAKEAGVNLFISKPLFQSTMFDLLVDTYGKYQVFHSEQENDNYNFVGKRLLLAEDNEMNREIAIDILMQYGFEVDCAENGQEAVEIFTKAQAGTYAAILMDIQMPVLNGHQATKAIRQSSHPEAQSIPVIAMTANAFSEDIAASHGAGMNDHISKPIDVDQMLEILKRHIH